MSKEDCFHLGVKALIFNPKRKLLLLERNHPQKIIYWDIPGGRMHRGESLIETLRREVKEETGFKSIQQITPLTMIHTEIRIPLSSGDVGLIFSIFCCHLSTCSDPILSEEHQNFGWFTPNEAAKKLKSHYPQHFIEKLNNLKVEELYDPTIL